MGELVKEDCLSLILSFADSFIRKFCHSRFAIRNS